MDRYVTGTTIKTLREKKGLTQYQLGEQLKVSDKTVSKWETAKGYPDITLLQPLAQALGVSTIELMSGDLITNCNRSSNMIKSQFYVCPICGNVFHSMGDAVICCCGITLPPLSADSADSAHPISVEIVEDELFITIDHPMTKEHYISFIAAIGPDRLQLVKLYPEGNTCTRFKVNGVKHIYAYCNKDGLFNMDVTIKNR